MKLTHRKVILITGPAGSGKTSLAERIAQNENWIHVSEDIHWVEIKKGHPAGELRTPEEQSMVQPAVVLQIRELLSKGNSVVLEFDRLAHSVLPASFELLELSPVCSLGTNSIVAPVDQDKAVTTIRNTESVFRFNQCTGPGMYPASASKR